MSHTLLMQRRFGPLFLAQLFSAFNDNFLKSALVFLILYELAGPNAESLISLAGGLFIAPFFVLGLQEIEWVILRDHSGGSMHLRTLRRRYSSSRRP
jgi:hypothetical protein